MFSATLLALVENPLDIHPTSPFILAAVTAIAFALMARYTGDSPLLWGIGGALLGLVTTAISVGFAVSVTNPDTPSNLSRSQAYAVAISILFIAVIGLIVFLSLGRGGRESGK